MLTFIKPGLWKTATVILVAVILFLSITWGVSSGKSNAQSQTILQDASGLKQSLDYFFKDQNRYPTALEFDSPEIMAQYLNNFPVPNLTSQVCPQTFIYKRLSSSSYQLNFCLPEPSGEYVRGWNSITY